MKPRFYWAACAVLLTACSPEPAAEKTVSAASASAATLTVPTARGDAVVPKNPERVAVYDWAALDTLTELGVTEAAKNRKAACTLKMPPKQTCGLPPSP